MKWRSFAKQSLLAVLLAALAAGSALAHHSYAMFDRDKDTVLKGTIRQFQWTNPHCYLEVVTDDGKISWTIEVAENMNGMIRRGYKRDMFKPGDSVTVHIHPLRNGALGGALTSVEKADGTVYKFYVG